MATGVTKNKWKSDTHIISKEETKAANNSFEIQYEGKQPAIEVINDTSFASFTPIFQIKEKSELFSNLLFYGDNIDAIRYLLFNLGFKEKVSLIYIDPPYGTNSVFHSRTNKDSYKDDLTGSHYLEFMRKRLILMRELLSAKGSIYVHLDNNMIFQIKVLMDEIFGTKNFRGFITRKKCSNKNYTKNTYGNVSDYILFYSKTDDYIWNRPTEAWTDSKILKEYTNIEPETGRKFKKVPIHAPGIRNGETGKPWKGMLPPPGKHWQFTPDKLDEFDKKGEIYWSENGNPRRKVYFDTSEGIAIQDIWLELQDSLNQSIKITGYPTEKNPFLLERIIKASSNENDIVLDSFVGSGTTIDVANQLNRRWIGIDNSSEAIDHIFKRFVVGLEEMGDYVTGNNKSDEVIQGTLFESLAAYNPEKKVEHFFTFYSDDLHLAESERLKNKWYVSSEIISEQNSHYENDLEKALKHLVKNDLQIKLLVNRIGPCLLNPRKSKFDYLIEAIISQQLSFSASNTIIKRIKDFYKGSLTPEGFLQTSKDDLKSLGISDRKISYILDLCSSIINKQLLLSDLESFSNEKIVTELTKVKGVGSWTAKMFLIFVLGRLNVFPHEDTAFMNQLKIVYNLSNNGSLEDQLSTIQNNWHPFETIGAWYIWKSIGLK